MFPGGPGFQALPAGVHDSVSGPDVHLFSGILSKIGGPEWNTMRTHAEFSLASHVEPLLAEFSHGARLLSSPAQNWLEGTAPWQTFQNCLQQARQGKSVATDSAST